MSTNPLLTDAGPVLAALRRAGWRVRLRLGTAGVLALALALLAGAGAVALALQQGSRQAQAAQLQAQLTQARSQLAAERSAAAQPAAGWATQTPPVRSHAAGPTASTGMKLDTGPGDEFIDPAQPPQPATAPRPAPGTAPAQALLVSLPPLAQRDEDLALLQALAREAGLGDVRTQYRRLDARSGQIDRLEVSLSASQDFETWRTLMVGLLNRLPHAAVTGVAFTRAQPEGGGTAARLSVVLHHRTAVAP